MKDTYKNFSKKRALEFSGKDTPFKLKVVQLKNKYTRKVKHKKGVDHD